MSAALEVWTTHMELDSTFLKRTEPLNPEDEPRTLIFVDMLGFAAFTEKHPTRTAESGPDEHGFSGSGTTELQLRVNTFQRILDQFFFEWGLYGGLPGMIFSDCAYLDGGNPLRSALIAVSLMQAFLTNDIPVRIGIGKGTYYPFKFSTEVQGSVVLARALFAGTAVVRAHAAEHGGGKGMRIFVSPSLEIDIPAIQQRVQVLPLSKPTKGAAWELDYSIQHADTRWPKKIDDWDNRVYAFVDELDDPVESPEVRIHYSETRDALDRMRAANGKTKFQRPSDRRL